MEEKVFIGIFYKDFVVGRKTEVRVSVIYIVSISLYLVSKIGIFCLILTPWPQGYSKLDIILMIAS